MADFKEMQKRIAALDKISRGGVSKYQETQEKLDNFVDGNVSRFTDSVKRTEMINPVEEADPGVKAEKLNEDTSLNDMYSERLRKMKTPSENYYSMYSQQQEARKNEIEKRKGLLGGIAEGYNEALAKPTPANLDGMLDEYEKKLKSGDEDFFYNLQEGFKQSELTQVLANEAYRKMMGMPNEYDKVNEFMDTHPEMYPSSDAKNLKWATRSASNFLGFMFGGFKEGLDDAAIAGMGAAGVAAVATAPLAPVSVPGALIAGASAGMSKGVYENMVVTEAGMNYIDMIDNGIDPDISRNVSLAVGSINGLIEAAQVANLTYGPGIQAATGAVKNFTTQAIIKSLVDVGSGMAITASEEALEEMVQEVSSLSAVEIAKYMQNQRDKEGSKPVTFTAEDFAGSPEKADQVIAVGIDTLAGTLVLGGARAGAGGAFAKTVDYSKNKGLQEESETLLYDAVPKVLDKYESGELEVNTADRADDLSTIKQVFIKADDSPKVKAADKEQAKILVDKIDVIENNSMRNAKENDSRVTYAAANVSDVRKNFMSEDFDLRSVEVGNKVTQSTINNYKKADSAGIEDAVLEMWMDGKTTEQITSELKKSTLKKEKILDANSMVSSVIEMNKEFKYQALKNAMNNHAKAVEVNRSSAVSKEIVDDRDVEAKPFDQLNPEPVNFAKIFVDPKNFRYSEKSNIDTISEILLWEDESGDLYLANGHESYIRAQQAGAENVNSTILPNAEYTQREARVFSQMINIADGNADAIEVAQLIRDKDLSEENAREIAKIVESDVASDIEKGIQLSLFEDNDFNQVAFRKVSVEEAIKAVEEVDEVVERQKPEKVSRTIEKKIKEKQPRKIKIASIEDVLGQPTLKLLYADRAKRQKTFKELQPMVESAQGNPFLKGITLQFLDKDNLKQFTEKELSENGYENYEAGEYKIHGEFIQTSETGETGKIILYRGASKDAFLEEIVHALQSRLQSIDPELNTMIKAWEKEIADSARKGGYSIPQGIELFAQAYVFSEAGYAKNNVEIANLIAIPDDIVIRFNKLLRATGDGRKAIIDIARGLSYPEVEKSLRVLNPDIDLNKVLTENANTIEKTIVAAQTDIISSIEKNGSVVTIDRFGRIAVLNSVEEIVDGKRTVKYELKAYDADSNNTEVIGFDSYADAVDEMVEGGYYYIFRDSKQKKTTPKALSMKPIRSLSKDMVNNKIAIADQNTADENVRYHAGDLGIAETYWRMKGDRGTGHFGTGTYFVKDSENLGEYASQRPVELIDVAGLNLVKLETESEYMELHDAMKYLNRVATLTGAYESIVASIGDEHPLWYSNDELSTAAINISNISLKLIGEEKTKAEAADMMMEAIMYGAQLTRMGYQFQATMDSPSTVFLKSLGFDGVDTQGIKGIDNTSIGGVIYRDTQNQYKDIVTLMTPEEILSQGLVSERMTKNGIEISILDPVTKQSNTYVGKYVDVVSGLRNQEEFALQGTKNFVINDWKISDNVGDLDKLLNYLDSIGIDELYFKAEDRFGFSLDGTSETDYMYETDEFFRSLNFVSSELDTDVYIRMIDDEFYINIPSAEYVESSKLNSYYSMIPANIEIGDSLDMLEAEEADFEVAESKLKKTMLESGMFSDSMKSEIEKDNFLYTRKVRGESVAQAMKMVQKDGWEKAEYKLTTKKDINDVDMAVYLLLMLHYNDVNDANSASILTSNIRPKITRMGQAISMLAEMKDYSFERQMRNAQSLFSGVAKKSNVENARKATDEMGEDLSEATKRKTGEKKSDIVKNATEKIKKKLTPEELLSRKIRKQYTLQTPPVGVNVMIDTLFKKAKELGVPTRRKIKADPFEVLADAIHNREEYVEVWKAAQEEVRKAFEDRPEIIAELDEYFKFDPDKGVVFPAALVKEAVDSAMIDLGYTIDAIVEEYFVLGKNNFKPTLASLVAEVKDKFEEVIGEVDYEELELISEIIADEVQRQVEEEQRLAIEKILVKRKYKPKTRQSIIDKTLELAKYGAFSDGAYYESLADKLGIPVMTPELADFIQSQSRLIRSLKDGSNDQLVAIAQLHEAIGSQIPVSTLLKLKTYRILMMLFNTHTWMKNIVGNSMFGSLDTLALQTFGKAFDMVAAKATGTSTRKIGLFESVKIQSKEFGGVLSAFGKNWKEFGFRDSVAVLREQSEKNKFEFKARKTFYRGKNGIVNVLSDMEDILTFALLLPDRAAYSASYIESMANQEMSYGGSVTTEAMQSKASHDALRRTFQDDSVLAVALERFRTAANTIVVRETSESGKVKFVTKTVDFGIGDILLPFVKTPANLIMRSIDYTPFGIIMGTTKGIYDYKKGRINKIQLQAELVEAYARAVTGTALIFSTGMMLGSKGIATGSRDDDDNDVYYVKQEAGYLNNAINFTGLARYNASGDINDAKLQPGDKFTDYSWIEPFGSTFAMGVEVGRAFQDGRAEGLNIDGLAVAALSAGIKSIEDQPLLQGISDLLQEDSFTKMIETTLVNAVGSFAPTLGNYLSIALTNVKAETYDATGTLNTAVNKLKKRIPGLSATLPTKYTRFGEPYNYFDEDSTAIGRMFSLLLNPAIKKEYNPSDEALFVIDLYEKSGETKQAPRYVSRTQTVTYRDPKTREKITQKIVLNNKEYSLVSKFAGDLVTKEYHQMKLSGYDKLAPDIQAKLMADRLSDVGRDVKEYVKEIKGLK